MREREGGGREEGRRREDSRSAGEKKRGGNEAVGDKTFSWRRQCVRAVGGGGVTANSHDLNKAGGGGGGGGVGSGGAMTHGAQSLLR